MLNIFITSDHHFGHDNIIRFEPGRITKMNIDGFDNQDEWLIDNWNSQINKNDKVLHLGDFFFKNFHLINRLNGKISMISGNHEKKNHIEYKKLEKIYRGIYIENDLKITNNHNDMLLSGLIIKLNNFKILFSHYPVFNNDKYDLSKEKISNRIKTLEKCYDLLNCNLNIHGHTHSKKSSFNNSFNVSIEATDFKILKLKEILEIYLKNNK